MEVVTYSHARNALKSILDDVVQDADVTIISRRMRRHWLGQLHKIKPDRRKIVNGAPLINLRKLCKSPSFRRKPESRILKIEANQAPTGCRLAPA
ncbi:MAG: hypothetical protein ACYCZQ_06555 [Burkholderiales bacterium]